MARAPAALGDQLGAALVRAHQLHQGGLADDRQRGLDLRRLHVVQQARHPRAAHFLVIGQGEMDRPLQRGPRHLRRQRQRHADEALHVASAAPVKPAIAHLGPERVARPGLPVHRHHIGMAR